MAETTYFPHSGLIAAGRHEELGPFVPIIGTMTAAQRNPSLLDVAHRDYQTPTSTKLYSQQLAALTAALHANRDKIMAGQINMNSLTGAAFVEGKSNLDHLILVKLHQQLQGALQRWFYLDEMFTSMPMDKLTMRISFKDNPAAAQKIPRRQEYNIARVAYDEILFNLEKLVVAYDMPIEDPMRALINPVQPLKDANEYANKYARELDALEALKELKYVYKKDAAAGEKFDSDELSDVQNTNAEAISNPTTIGAGGIHSAFKTVNEIQTARTEFLTENDNILTHAACSPKTAMEIAQNTWTGPNTIFNVEAYRTAGGVRPFPGLSDATMVISAICPNDILYWSSKPSLPLVLGEGPKMTQSWNDYDRWTDKTASADFYQYKCAHEDLNEITRKFGCIMKISSA